MSCRTSCLGPCNLGPVMQVWPEGTTYCWVDEAVLDDIIAEHLIDGRPAERQAYAPSARKQRLRDAPPETDQEGMAARRSGSLPQGSVWALSRGKACRERRTRS